MIYLVEYKNGVEVGPMDILVDSGNDTVPIHGLVGLRKALGDKLTPFTARSNWTDYIEWMGMRAATATLPNRQEHAADDDLAPRHDAPVGVIYKGERAIGPGIREHLTFVSLGEAALGISTQSEKPLGGVSFRYHTEDGTQVADLSYRDYTGGYFDLSGTVKPLQDGLVRDAMQDVWDGLELDRDAELPSPSQALVVLAHSVGEGHLRALHQYLESMR